MKTKLITSVFVLLLTGCGGSAGTDNSTASSHEKSFQLGSVEVGSEIPNNGVRPVETLCTAGSFVRVSTNTDACGAEQFDVFLDSGYYATRGFTDKEYYFFDAGTETYETPSVINNGLSLFNVPVDGEENSVCAFFCSEDNQSMRVLCTAPGKIVCGETVYARVADAPVNPVAPVDPSTDPSSIATGDSAPASCSQASGTYTFQQVSCNPGLTLYPEQVGDLPPLEVNSPEDLSATASSNESTNFLPNTTSEAHFECSLDGTEVHLISNASSNGFDVSCDYLYLRS